MSEPNIIDEVERAKAILTSPWSEAAENLAKQLYEQAFATAEAGETFTETVVRALTAALTSSRDQVIEECAKVAALAEGLARPDYWRGRKDAAKAIRSLKVQPDKGLLEGGSAK